MARTMARTMAMPAQNSKTLPNALSISRTCSDQRHHATGTENVTSLADMDHAILSANGWTWVDQSGTTAQRPTGTLGQYNANEGSTFFDTSLGYVIKYAGGAWRNPSTGAAV